MTLRQNFFRRPDLLPLVGLIFSALFWLIDVTVDFIFFNDDNLSFQQILFFPEPMDLWMRTLVVFMLLIFAIIARKLLLDELRAKLELEDYKNSLEKKVEERTQEIQIKNNDLHREIRIRQDVERELQHLAITDPLTGLCNRRMFHQLLNNEIERDIRYQGGLGLILCDLDNFKRINDNFGHGVGDKVLQVFAENTRKYLRDSDILARWGGEEFILLIPQTNLEKTQAIAQKLQEATEKITVAPVGSFTGSFGVTIFYSDDTTESFIKRADDALYQAKRNGRNRVETMIKDKGA